MKIKKIAITLSIVALINNIISCTPVEETITVMKPGSYEKNYHIESTIGKNNSITKQIDGDKFTSDYDAVAIYIHSLTGTQRVVKYNVQTNLPECQDCQGIRVKYTISEDGQQATLIGDDGQNATFNLTEEVYLSSIPDENWTHTTCGTTPITQSQVLSRDATKNIELYRSFENLSITDLLQGTGGCASGLLMDRVCTAFKVYFLFSDLDNAIEIGNTKAYPSPSIEKLSAIGITNINEIAAKIYLGPMFCTEFNLNTLTAKDNSDVYYATANNTYQNFTATSVGDIDYDQNTQITYGGYGITSPEGYLITPYNKSHTGGYHFYAFVKNNNENPNDNTGALYTEYTINTVSQGALNFNQCEIIIIVYDYKQLAAFAQTNLSGNKASTRNYWESPQKIDLKPAKVIRIIE